MRAVLETLSGVGPSAAAAVVVGTALVVLGVAARAPAARAYGILSALVAALLALPGDAFFGPIPLHTVLLAELPIALFHLAVVFPLDRSGGAATALAVPYVLAALTAVAWTLFPEARPHLPFDPAGPALPVLVLALFLVKTFADYRATTVPVVLQRVQLTLVAIVVAVLPPNLCLLLGAERFGIFPPDALALSAPLFLFPLGVAIARRRLFAGDELLQRAVLYALFLGTIGLVHFGIAPRLAAIGTTDPTILTLLLTVVLVAAKDRLRRLVERLLFRKRHDPARVLEWLSTALAASPKLDQVLPVIWRSVSQALGVHEGRLFVPLADGSGYVAGFPRLVDPERIAPDHAIVRSARWKQGPFTAYDPALDEAPRAVREGLHQALEELHAEIVVPLTVQRNPALLVGLLVIGAKRSGAYYTPRDLGFLAAVASQSALSISNALAYDQIETLNHGLERKVKERTQALARTNEELHESLQQLEIAYSDLQQSRESLTRAERLAALGRLTAGVAHEVNTPLGASLTSLRLMRDLVAEYKESIADPEVDENDRREIVAEIDPLLANTEGWIQKASAFIRSLKLHTRSSTRGGETRPFSVLGIVEDTRILLSHRLRVSDCELEIVAPDEVPALAGDGSKLGQVLANLVSNAIDAYDDVHDAKRIVRVEIRELDSRLEIRVLDRGKGIPAENRERVFDEFFSTKPLGGGTGLGLAICRQIVTADFGGTIEIEPRESPGTTFLLRLPLPEGPPAVLAATG